MTEPDEIIPEGDILEPPPEQVLDVRKGVPVNLTRDGVLWAINATLLHPRGFALAIDEDGALHMCGDGTDPIGYVQGVWPEITERFVAFESLLDAARHANGA